MEPEHDVPDQGEHEPREQEAGEEYQGQVAPPQIHQRGPAVLEEEEAPLLHPDVDHPQVSILLDQSSCSSFPVEKRSQFGSFQIFSDQ